MCRKEWTIEWRVKLVFPEAGQEYCEERYVMGGGVGVVYSVCVCGCRVGEAVLLRDMLKKYIHSSESDPVIRHR